MKCLYPANHSIESSLPEHRFELFTPLNVSGFRPEKCHGMAYLAIHTFCKALIFDAYSPCTAVKESKFPVAIWQWSIDVGFSLS